MLAPQALPVVHEYGHALHCGGVEVGALSLLGRGAVEKKTVLENLDLILLAMDETVDGGCALSAHGSGST